MKSPHKLKSRQARILRYVGMMADAAGVVMGLRDNPTRLDWIAASTRLAALGLKLRAQIARSGYSETPWQAFLNDEWRCIPDAVEQYAVRHAQDVEVVADFSDADDAGPLRCRGFLGEGREVIEWLENGDGEIEAGPAVKTRRYAQSLSALGPLVWGEFSSPQLSFDGRNFSERPDDAVQPLGDEFDALCERLGLFLEHGISRAVLFEGRPGTGKSTAIRGIVQRLGLGSVHVELSNFARRPVEDEPSALSIAGVVDILRPEVLILDDIDRVGRDPSLLRLLEIALRRCRLVLASVNQIDKLDAALRRPGRFDEVLRIDRLDPTALQRMVGDKALAKRMQSWPAAYVSEWVKRRTVLGEEAALAELDDLETRISQVGDALETDDEEAAPTKRSHLSTVN